MGFTAEMKGRTDLVDAALDACLATRPPEGLYEAMRYSLFAGGKRLRPLLLLATYEACGGGGFAEALPFACALELIHTYSLIHDDLPCMDDDDTRRGKPSLHKAYGEAAALLAGDGLLNTAFELMARSCAEGGAATRAAAMAEIAAAAGTEGMIGGQFVDVINDGVAVDGITLEYIHRNKTARLIRAALAAGAILAGAEDMLPAMAELGERLGLAFQIKDDMLDVTADPADLGKPTGSDAKNRKNTWVSLWGLEAAEAEYNRLSDTVKWTLSALDAEPGTAFLKGLCRAILERGR